VGSVKKAFTLIELLVVITIIAVLAAMVMPSLGKGRTAANRVSNNSNMKGLVTSIQAQLTMNTSSKFPKNWKIYCTGTSGGNGGIRTLGAQEIDADEGDELICMTGGNSYLTSPSPTITMSEITPVFTDGDSTSAAIVEETSAGEKDFLSMFKGFNGKHKFDSDTGIYQFFSVYFDPNGTTVYKEPTAPGAGSALTAAAAAIKTNYITKKKSDDKVPLVGEYYELSSGDGEHAIAWGDGHVTTSSLTAGGNSNSATIWVLSASDDTVRYLKALGHD
jgi:prepilin-type N-terminal cleavage/methylation domain-containing protein